MLRLTNPRDLLVFAVIFVDVMHLFVFSSREGGGKPWRLDSQTTAPKNLTDDFGTGVGHSTLFHSPYLLYVLTLLAYCGEPGT